MRYFFDLDETLLDHGRARHQGLSRLSEKVPALGALTTKKFIEEWHRLEAKHFSRFERGEISIEEFRRERFREIFPEYCGSLSEPELDQLFGHYMSGYRAGWVLYPDVLPTFLRLGGPFSIITNGDGRLQRAKVQRLGISSFLSDAVISGEIGHAKPSVEVFRIACERAGVQPDEVCFVGDDFRRDVVGAVEAGMKGVWLNRLKEPCPLPGYEYREIDSLYAL